MIPLITCPLCGDRVRVDPQTRVVAYHWTRIPRTVNGRCSMTGQVA